MTETSNTQLWQMGALELAEAIRTGETSSREVLEAHLVRIDAVNPHLNAVVRRMDDEARAAADAADAAVAAGAELGTFHGVPVSIKENIDVKGHPTTLGVTVFADAVAAVDAPSTERVRAAGAIPFARTNLPDFGLRVHTDSQLHGLTRNPWNPAVTAGGSSGGEASAISSGMSPLGVGNDIGGSLRNPAHCCGIASHKPTVGLVPMAASLPPEDFMIASQLMLVEGPMARNVADVRAGFEMLAVPHIRDPRSIPARLDDSEPGERLTIAVMADPPGGTTDSGIASAIRSVGDQLSNAGHNVVEATPPDYEEVMDLWGRLLFSEVRVVIDLLAEVTGEGAQRVLSVFNEAIPSTDFPLGQTLHGDRNRVMKTWSAFHAEYPILLSPTWAQPAFSHETDADPSQLERMINTIRPVMASNLLGSPATITPAGVADGLPVGVQVMGDRFSDLLCLTVAAEIESLVGTITPIDPVLA